MTSLTAIFGRARDDSSDSDKLLELYWNRAELKKEFANLRNETFRLKDRIKEEKGNAARSQQQLLQLENLLLDPEWVHTVGVHYQFRALYTQLERKVARFAEQLKQQREQRQHRQVLAAWTGKRDAEVASLEADRSAVREQLREADQALQSVQARYSSMNRILRFFRKRSTKRTLDAIAESIEAGQVRERELGTRLVQVKEQEIPDVQGLDIQAKRSINCMILAFAQQVYLHYRQDNVASMARDAGTRSVGAVQYGSKAECDNLLARIHRLQDSMVKTGDFAEVLQQRTRLIAERVRFSSDDDAIPDTGTTETVFDILESGQVRELNTNLLKDNYWNVLNVLSR